MRRGMSPVPMTRKLGSRPSARCPGRLPVIRCPRHPSRSCRWKNRRTRWHCPQPRVAMREQQLAVWRSALRPWPAAATCRLTCASRRSPRHPGRGPVAAVPPRRACTRAQRAEPCRRGDAGNLAGARQPGHQHCHRAGCAAVQARGDQPRRRPGVACRQFQRRGGSDELPAVQAGGHVAGLRHHLIGAVGTGQPQQPGIAARPHPASANYRSGRSSTTARPAQNSPDRIWRAPGLTRAGQIFCPAGKPDGGASTPEPTLRHSTVGGANGRSLMRVEGVACTYTYALAGMFTRDPGAHRVP
jgi:hypothetical protein